MSTRRVLSTSSARRRRWTWNRRSTSTAPGGSSADGLRSRRGVPPLSASVSTSMSSQGLIEEIDYCDPFEALSAFALEPGLVFLDSAMAHPELGRWSWLAPDPFGRFTSLDGTAFWN